MSIRNHDIAAMRNRINSAIDKPKRRRRKKVQKAMQQLSFADFLTSML